MCNRAVCGPNNATTGPANMRLTDITDGTSNTMLVGERDGYRNFAATWGAAFANNFSTASFEGRPGNGLNLPYNTAGPFPPTAGNNPFNYDNRLVFSSMHLGVSGFVFCDGSVHMISDAVDADPADLSDDSNWATTTNFTLQNLYWPQDGHAMNATWW